MPHLMDISDALLVMESLANGYDPVTGQSLPIDSPLHHPQIVRALFTVTRALEAKVQSTRHRDNASGPQRAGAAWNSSEDEQLIAAFRTGDSVNRIAKAHRRSRGAIVARLVRLGYIQKSSDPIEDTCQNEASWRKDRPQAGKKWTPEDDALLRTYVHQGLTNEDIAARLGRGTFAVDVRRVKLSLNTEPPKDEKNSRDPHAQPERDNVLGLDCDRNEDSRDWSEDLEC
jgi:hypothetical protein